MKKIKIFNFGLPRTGTTSFHLYMKNNAFNSVHTNHGFINKCFPKDYFDFLNDENLQNNSISLHINKYQVFSDLPWYSFKLRKKIIDKYKNDPNVYFIYTTRNKQTWIKSIKKIIPYIKSKSEKEFHKMEYNGILSNKHNDADINISLDKFYDTFHAELKANENIYELSLDDIDSLKSTLHNLFDTDINMTYPKVN
tara:strand:+ start:427 stop:1014 length:588 start_codon:yes stop_codon:yes gene_type:complete